jgi:hypothetical protein
LDPRLYLHRLNRAFNVSASERRNHSKRTAQ